MPEDTCKTLKDRQRKTFLKEGYSSEYMWDIDMETGKALLAHKRPHHMLVYVIILAERPAFNGE